MIARKDLKILLLTAILLVAAYALSTKTAVDSTHVETIDMDHERVTDALRPDKEPLKAIDLLDDRASASPGAITTALVKDAANVTLAGSGLVIDEKKNPIQGVIILDCRTSQFLAETDEYGTFVANPSIASILVDHPGYISRIIEWPSTTNPKGKAVEIVLKSGGSIPFFVHDHTGIPLEGIVVEVTKLGMGGKYRFIGSSEERQRYSRLLRGGGSSSRVAITDNAGFAVVAGLEPARFDVRATGSGFRTTRLPDAAGISWSSPLAPLVDIRMDEGAPFTGRVVDTHLVGIAEATVETVFDDGVYQKASTGADGYFSISGYSGGLFGGEIRITHADYAVLWEDRTSFQDGQKYQLIGRRSLMVNLTTKDGLPVTGEVLVHSRVSPGCMLIFAGSRELATIAISGELRVEDLNTQVHGLKFEFNEVESNWISTADAWEGEQEIAVALRDGPGESLLFSINRRGLSVATGDAKVFIVTETLSSKGFSLTGSVTVPLESIGNGAWLADASLAKLADAADAWVLVTLDEVSSPLIQIRGSDGFSMEEPISIQLK